MGHVNNSGNFFLSVNMAKNIGLTETMTPIAILIFDDGNSDTIE
jgi:hypothetical protein